MRGSLFLLACLLRSQLVCSGPLGVNLPPIEPGTTLSAEGWHDFSSVDVGVFRDLFMHASAWYCTYCRTDSSKQVKCSLITYRFNNPPSPPFLTACGEDGIDGGASCPTYPSRLYYKSAGEYDQAVAFIGRYGDRTPAGNYVVLFQGEGEIQFAGDAEVIARIPNDKYTDAKDLYIKVTPASGVEVRIVRTNETDPVRNIRILPLDGADFLSTSSFRGAFLQALAGFHVIRFGMWQETIKPDDGAASESTPRLWKHRALPEGPQGHQQWRKARDAILTKSADTTAIDPGVAVELMVELANSVHASPWFCMPPPAPEATTNPELYDDYSLQFASLVGSSLSPDLQVYVEWCSGTNYANWNKFKSLAVFRAWKKSLDDIRAKNASVPHLVRVISTSNYITQIVDHFGTDLNFVDAVAIRARFGMETTGVLNDPTRLCFEDLDFPLLRENITIDQILDVMRENSLHSERELNARIQQMKELFLIKTGRADVPILSYRGGPFVYARSYGHRAAAESIRSCIYHDVFPCESTYGYGVLDGPLSAAKALETARANAALEFQLEEKLINASRHPRMTGIFMDFLERWQRIGGDVFVTSELYKPPWACPLGGKDCGSNGLMESLTDSPKFQAIQNHLRKLPLIEPFTSADLQQEQDVPCSPPCLHGTCWAGVCECWRGYAGSDCTQVVERPSQCEHDVGMNLAGVNDWVTEWVFVDIFKSSRDWISQDFISTVWDTNVPIALGDNDYPTELKPNQKVGTMMIRGLNGHAPAGLYIVNFDGDGILMPTMSDIKSLKRGVGRLEVGVHPSTEFNNGFFLSIERTNTQDPIRNIRVTMPGFESRASKFPFHPWFLQSIEHYKALRFMDWSKANDVQSGSWSHRTQIDTRTYAGSVQYDKAAAAADTNSTTVRMWRDGVPIEMMVRAANEVGADAWFTVPYNADDSYVREMASLVLSSLRRDVKVYLEWSNEGWNPAFQCGQYAQAKGLELGLQEGGWYGGDANEARICYVGYRTGQIAKIWREVFGAEADRIVVVASSQAGWTIVTDRLLSCHDAYKEIDVVGVAPYLNSLDISNRSLTLDVMFQDALPASIKEGIRMLEVHQQSALLYNKSLVLYESGQSLLGDGSEADLAILANRDPRMRDMYERYYQSMLDIGITGVKMHFTSAGLPGKYGSWGLLEATDQNKAYAHKYQGLLDYMRTNFNCCAKAYEGCLNNCSSHGECLSSRTCACFYGYQGDDCGEIRYVDVVDCGYKCTFEQGSCDLVRTVDEITRYFACSCEPGFSGITCSLFNSSCNGNGETIDLDVCSCYPGYRGVRCEVDCKCNGHGRCGGNETCECDEGWRWGGGGCEWDCDCAEDVECVGPGECSCSPACQYGSCYHGSCLCWAGAEGIACDKLAEEREGGSSIGLNLQAATYWSSQWIFSDVMKQSSEWFPHRAKDTGPGEWDTGEPILLDDQGWPLRLGPRQALGKLMMRSVQQHAPSGRFLVEYEGRGSIKFGFDSKVISRSKNRMQVEFYPSVDWTCIESFQSYCGDNGMYLWIDDIDPLDPIRNIRIFPASLASTGSRFEFHPFFLRDVSPFGSLRFMDWQGINDARVQQWSERTLPGSSSQANVNKPTDAGMALEHMVSLANVLGSSPWFCIPHTASDEYVEEMAKLVRRTLRPDVKIFLEHSNEVWTSGHKAGAYCEQRGLQLGLSTNKDEARWRYNAMRSRQIWETWRREFGNESHRIVRVLSTWAISPVVSSTMLEFNETWRDTDVLATTGYLDCKGLGASRKTEAMTMEVEEILDECEQSIEDVISSYLQHKQVADAYGIPVGFYEAGPALMEASAISSGSFTAALTRKFFEVHRSPRMGDIYRLLLSRLNASGFLSPLAPYMHFSSVGLPTQYGSWGALEYTGQSPELAHKYRAMLPFLEERMSARRSCVDLTATRFYVSLLDRGYLGPPAVTSPRAGDKWAQGSRRTVRWDAAGADSKALVRISLWHLTDCNGTQHQVALLALAAPNVGELEILVPRVQLESDKFFIAIVGAAGTNYSEPFAISSPHALLASSWGPCSSQCGMGYRTRSVSCVKSAILVPQTVAMSHYPDQRVCTMAENCFQHPLSRDWRQQRCERWDLNFFDDGARSLSACYLDESGCRMYRTGTVDYTSSFKLVQDCTEINADFIAPVTRPAEVVPLAQCLAMQLPPLPSSEGCFDAPCEDFGWRAGAWGGCSAACGGGSQTRPVECVDRDGVVRDDTSCDPSSKPATSQSCNMVACPQYQWQLDSWSPCSSSCGNGTMTRRVTCKSSSGLPVLAVLCSPETPAERSACEGSACGESANFSWVVSNWQLCNVTCGGGFQNRTVKCLDTRTSKQVGDEVCGPSQHKPALLLACNRAQCSRFAWYVGEWSACSGGCNLEVKTRSASCFSVLEEKTVPSEMCSSLLKPRTFGFCELPACGKQCEQVDCSGHGACNENFKCECEEGWTGDKCSADSSSCSTGLFDKEGVCCNGVVDVTGICCEEDLSADGRCCHGVVDACGVCNGSSTLVDLSGSCCSSSQLDSSGYCCDDAELDECGVCDGDGSSCGAVLSFSVPLASSSGVLGLSEISALAQIVLPSLAASLLINSSSFQLLEVSSSSSSSSSSSRRMLSDAVSVKVWLGSGVMNISFPFSSHQAAELLASNPLLSTAGVSVERRGVCGNGVCEIGEVCGGSGSCCMADCKITILSCPIGSSGRVCNDRGRCLSSGEACDCFQGYEGRACEACSEGFMPTMRNKSLLCSSNVSRSAASWNIPPPWSTSQFLQYPECVDSRGWEDMGKLVANGTAQTGGLGRMMLYPIEVWICIRGHDCLKRVEGADVSKDMMCFVFHEDKKIFLAWNTNDVLKLTYD